MGRNHRPKKANKKCRPTKEDNFLKIPKFVPQKYKPTKQDIADDAYLEYRKFLSQKIQILTKEQFDEFNEALKDYLKYDVYSDTFKVVQDENGEPNLLQIGFPKSISPLVDIGNHIKLFQFYKSLQTDKKNTPLRHNEGNEIFPIKRIYTGFCFENETNISDEKLSEQAEFYYFRWGELIIHKDLIGGFKYASKEMKEKWWVALREAENEFNKDEKCAQHKYKVGQMMKPFGLEQNWASSSSFQKDSSVNALKENQSCLIKAKKKKEKLGRIMARLFALLERGEEIDESETDSSSNESETDLESDEEQNKSNSEPKSAVVTSEPKFDNKPQNKPSVELKANREVIKKDKTTSKLPLELSSASNRTDKCKNKPINSTEDKTQSNIKRSNIKSTSKSSDISKKNTEMEICADASSITLKRSFESFSKSNKTLKSSGEVKNKSDPSREAMSDKVVCKSRNERESISKPPKQKDCGDKTKVITNEKFVKKKLESLVELKPDYKIVKTDAIASDTLKRTVELPNKTSGEAKKPKIYSQNVETKSKVATECNITSEKLNLKPTNIINQTQNEIATKGTKQISQKRSHESSEESKANRKIEISGKSDANSNSKCGNQTLKSVSSDSGKDKTKHFRSNKDETKSDKVSNKRKIENVSNSKQGNSENEKEANKSDEQKLDKSNKDNLESNSTRKVIKENEKLSNSPVDKRLKKKSQSSVQPIESYRTGESPKATNHSVASGSGKPGKQVTKGNSDNETQSDKPKKRKLIEQYDPTVSVSINPTNKQSNGSTSSASMPAPKNESKQNPNNAIQPKSSFNKMSDSKCLSKTPIRYYFSKPKEKRTVSINVPTNNESNSKMDVILGLNGSAPIKYQIPKNPSRPTEQNASNEAPKSPNSSGLQISSKLPCSSKLSVSSILPSSSKHPKFPQSEKYSPSGSKQTFGPINKRPITTEKSSPSGPNHHHYPQSNKQVDKLIITNNSRPPISPTKVSPISMSDCSISKAKESLHSMGLIFNGNNSQSAHNEISHIKTSDKNSFADSAIGSDSGSPNSNSNSSSESSEPKEKLPKNAFSSASQSIPKPQSNHKQGPLFELSKNGGSILFQELIKYRALVLSMVHCQRDCTKENQIKQQYYLLTAVHYVDETATNGENMDTKPVTTRILRLNIVEDFKPETIQKEFRNMIKKFQLAQKYLVVVTEDALKDKVPSQYPQLSQELIDLLLCYLNPIAWGRIKFDWNGKINGETNQQENDIDQELERYRKPHEDMPIRDNILREKIHAEIIEYRNKFETNPTSFDIDEAVCLESPTVVARRKFPTLFKAKDFYRSIPGPEQIKNMKQTLVQTSDMIASLIYTVKLTRQSAIDWSFIKLNRDLFECAEFRSLYGNDVYDKIDKKMYGFDC